MTFTITTLINMLSLPGLCPLRPRISPPGTPPGSLLAAFALAWTASLVIPGASAGLGVFELVLVLWLGGIVQEEAALLAPRPQLPGGVHHGGCLGGHRGLGVATLAGGSLPLGADISLNLLCPC